jgi:diguanylate cyclase (GGDEF)-like protein/PAS domain S-box-containing protein
LTRLLEDFAQVSCDWFWEMDENLRFTYFSNRWEAVFGFSPEREIGKSRLEIAQNAEDQALWKPHLEDLLARRPFRDLTYPYRHKDGTVRWLRVSGQPVFGPAGEFQGYRGVGTNVTVEIEADEKLAEALTELKRANSRLEIQNLLFDTALNNMSHGLCMWDAGLRIIVCNKRFLEIYGFSEVVVKPGASLREVMNHSVAIGNHPGETVDDLYNSYLQELASRGCLTKERQIKGQRTIAVAHRPMSDGSWVTTYEEITERKQHLQELQRREEELRIQNERFDAAINNMGSGLCMFDANHRLIVCNARYAQMYGLSLDVMRPGTTLRSILESRIAAGCYPGNDPDRYIQERTNFVRVGQLHDTIHLRDGRVILITHHKLPGSGWVATHQDVTEQKRVEAKISHMAHHDALTNLPNRLLFRERLCQGLERVKSGEKFAVICLDLDGFKGVNDTLGHSIGDALLRVVTERLLKCLGDGDTVARLGGDEFAVLQAGAGDGDEAAGLASILISAVGEPYNLDGHEVIIGTSAGIALAPSDGSAAEELLKKADMALYQAKNEGRGLFRLFRPEMDTSQRARHAMERDLNIALAQGQFELFYQPVINIQSGRVTSCEALLRWCHPAKGLVMPGEFIGLAEETGLIVPLGDWVLRQACKEASKWPDEIKIAVNLSAMQFRRGNLVEVVIHALASSGLPANRLELEVTETVLLIEHDRAFSTLHQLRDLGVRIAVDDFGTGYSSFSYLRKYPFDKIKIDRSFVQESTEQGNGCAAIIKAIAGVGNSLGMMTTAEGVETEEQLKLVRAEGCTEVQGYLFSRPRPASEILNFIAKSSLAVAKVA